VELLVANEVSGTTAIYEIQRLPAR